MQNIEIYINNLIVDYYENSGFNLEFKKVIDDWLNFGGSLSITTSPLAESINIPATKRNTSILYNSNINSSDNLYVQAVLCRIQIYLNGYIVFIGSGSLNNVEYKNGLAFSYSISVKATGQDIIEAMQIPLNELDLGATGSTVADMEASKTLLSNTLNPILWPLVNYGGITVGGNDIQYTSWRNNTGFRPAVRFYKIIEAFALQNGYSVGGELYNNPQFQNSFYAYGVGEEWERSDNYLEFACHANVSLPLSIPDNNFIIFDDTSPPFYDPQSLNVGFFAAASATLSLDITKSGWYDFEILVDSPDDIAFDVVITNITNSSPQILFSNQQKNLILRTGLIDFHLPDPLFGLEGNRTVLKIYARRLSGSGNVTISQNSYYKAKMNKRAQLGAPIRIASCLHKRTFKEFLKGILRMYGAVLLIDNVLKTLTLEVRFVNDLGETLPDYIQNTTKSYYKAYEPSIELYTNNAEASTSNEKPFGDNLGIYFAQEESDGTLQIINETADPLFLNSTVPLYSATIELGQIGKEGQNYDDTYFTPLINSKFKSLPTIANFTNQLYYPTIIDDKRLLAYESLGNSSSIYPTFKSSPKCFVYYGILDMTGKDNGTNYYSLWEYERPISGAAVRLSYQVATVFQLFPDHPTYFDFIQNPFNLIFPSLSYNFAPIGKVLGLLETYYYKYLSIIFNDKIIRVRARLKLVNFWEQNFRNSFLVELQGQTTKCWCIGIENYNPKESEFADYTLVVDFQYINDYEFGKTNRNFKPVILMFSDLKAINDGE
jgi:hypothetical protein